jgi:hypothetical protein
VSAKTGDKRLTQEDWVIKGHACLGPRSHKDSKTAFVMNQRGQRQATQSLDTCLGRSRERNDSKESQAVCQARIRQPPAIKDGGPLYYGCVLMKNYHCNDSIVHSSISRRRSFPEAQPMARALLQANLHKLKVEGLHTRYSVREKSSAFTLIRDGNVGGREAKTYLRPMSSAVPILVRRGPREPRTATL